MEKTKIQAITLITLLAAAALIWFIPALRKSQETKPEYTGYITEEEIIEDFFKKQEQMEAERPSFTWARDPFQLKPKEIAPKSPVEGLMLSGIATDEQGKLAIINDEIVREGDKILDATIIEITEDKVKVNKDGTEYTLKIF